MNFKWNMNDSSRAIQSDSWKDTSLQTWNVKLMVTLDGSPKWVCSILWEQCTSGQNVKASAQIVVKTFQFGLKCWSERLTLLTIRPLPSPESRWWHKNIKNENTAAFCWGCADKTEVKTTEEINVPWKREKPSAHLYNVCYHNILYALDCTNKVIMLQALDTWLHRDKGSINKYTSLICINCFCGEQTVIVEADLNSWTLL